MDDPRASDAAAEAGEGLRQFLDSFARFGGRTFKRASARFVNRSDLDRYLQTRGSQN